MTETMNKKLNAWLKKRSPEAWRKAFGAGVAVDFARDLNLMALIQDALTGPGEDYAYMAALVKIVAPTCPGWHDMAAIDAWAVITATAGQRALAACRALKLDVEAGGEE